MTSMQYPPSPPWSTRSKRMVLVILLVLGTLMLYLIRAVLVPVIMSVVVAYVLLPIIRFIHEKTPLSRGLSIAAVYIFIVAALVAIPITTIPPLVTQGSELIESLPSYAQQVGELLTQPVTVGPFTIPLDQWEQLPILDDILDNLTNNAISLAQTVGQQSISVLSGVAGATLSGLGWLIVVLVLSFYMVADHRVLFDSAIDMIPAKHRRDVYYLGVEISDTWNAFLRGQLLLCLAIGIVTFIVALIIGLPNALLLALIAGIAEFIPNLGPILASIPAVIIAFVQNDASWLGVQMSPFTFAIVVLVLYIIIQQVENIVLVPRIIGRSLGLHPFLVFLGAIAGAGVAGILGILLAAPVLATVRLILLYVARKLSDQQPFPLSAPVPLPEIPDKIDSSGEELTSPEEDNKNNKME